MDIQHLVDRLEDLVDEGRHMPFSKYTLVDEERALEIIDQMRISIPEEIEKSSRVLATRDRIMAQANEEAARVVQIARQRSEHLLDQEVSVQAAQNRAANIIEQARQEADALMAGADSYVLEVLTQLEQDLLRTLTVVRNGIQEVKQSPRPASEPQPQSLPAPAAAAPAPAQPRFAARETVDAEVSARPESSSRK